MEPSKGTIVRRVTSFFTLSLIWTASINVLPQLYLLTYAPDRKSLALSIILFVGTMGSILGVSFSQWRQRHSHTLTRQKLCSLTLCYLGFLLLVVFEVSYLSLYILAFLVFRFTSNWLFNHLDHTLLRAAGSEGTHTHASAMTGFQLTGRTLGPVVFVFLAGQPLLLSILLLVLCCASTVVVLDALPSNPPTTSSILSNQGDDPKTELVETSQKFSSQAILFLLYSLLVNVSIIGFFTQFIYLLRDYIQIGNPAQTGGILITLTGAVSIVTVFVSLRFQTQTLSLWSLMWPPIVVGVALSWLAIRPSLPELYMASFLAGVGGGRFYLLTRLMASSWDLPPGRETVLSFYNNIGNYASLVAYVVLGILAFFLEASPHMYHIGLFGTLLSLLALALILMGFGYKTSTSTPIQRT